jgi:hypothetical protein
MGVHVYTAYNSAMATTAAQASVSTGTTIFTALQVASPSTRMLTLVSWSWQCDDPPGADAVIELIETDVAATVTAHVASGVQPKIPGVPASLVTLGVNATGFTASAEGSPTTTRIFDTASLSSTSGESVLSGGYQWLPNERPVVNVSKFLRVRVTTPTTAVGFRCSVTWEE